MDDQKCIQSDKPSVLEPCKPKRPCPAVPVWTVGIWSNVSYFYIKFFMNLVRFDTIISNYLHQFNA